MQWYLTIGAVVICFSFATFLKKMDIDIDELEPIMKVALLLSIVLCTIAWPAVVFIAMTDSRN